MQGNFLMRHTAGHIFVSNGMPEASHTTLRRAM